MLPPLALIPRCFQKLESGNKCIENQLLYTLLCTSNMNGYVQAIQIKQAQAQAIQMVLTSNHPLDRMRSGRRVFETA